MSTAATTGTGADLALYTRTAEHSAATVIGDYSSSFGLASRLLAAEYRGDVRNIYSLVRIADEVVDGAAEQAGLDPASRRAILDSLEVETDSAVALGYSTNLVVHSFAKTARSCGIDRRLTAPFFASMRRDLEPVQFTEEELAEYVYGSAEVVGLMCLRVFLRDSDVTEAERARLEAGACRLGSAFQKVNFLRDLATDWRELGRNYFPDVVPGGLTDNRKIELVTDIRSDLAAAAEVIPELPPGCLTAIVAAHDLFSELADRIERTPAAELMESRVRVPDTVKARLLARAFAVRRPRS
jgi:phytoene/squalene synthetase